VNAPDPEIEVAAEALHAAWMSLPPEVQGRDASRALAIAVRSAIDAHRNREDRPWEWGFRDRWGDVPSRSGVEARRSVSCWPTVRTLVRRRPASPWEEVS
jgi:hypothetical protein